jgi:CHAT domain-containing protein
LLEPLKARLQSKKRWIISPDGALALIPFESLIFEDKPVIANYSVSYVQSLSVLALLKKRDQLYQSLKKEDSLLAVGAARYELIKKLSVRIVTKPNALPALILKSCYHFSAHGYLSTENPALSAIVLDQLHKTPNADGYITMPYM